MDGVADTTQNGHQAADDEKITMVREDFNRLRGRLFQTLEAVGLPDGQCEAAKGLIRRLTYDMQSSLESKLRGVDN